LPLDPHPSARGVRGGCMADPKITQPNLVRDDIPALIRYIAIPASIGTIFTTMYNVVDTYWAGQLSTDSLAALSLNFPVYLVVMAIGVGFSQGANALISNYLGARREDRARHIFAQAIGFTVIAQTLLSVPLFLLIRPIFSFMNAEAQVIPRAFGYASVIVIGGIFISLNSVFNSALAARGNSKIFRNSLIVGFFLNLALDPLLMRGVSVGGVMIIPALEERGIALATILIQALTAIYILRKAVAAGALKGMSFRDFIPERKAASELISQVLPAMMSFMVMAMGTFVITWFISRYGTDVVAAYGSALRVEQIALIPNMGLTFALSALVGQNNGAGRIDRVRQSLRTTMRYGLYIMIALLTPVLLFGRHILGIFTDDPDVIRIGYQYLLIQGLTFYSYILLFQANSVLQGLKKPAMTMWMGLYRQVIAPAGIFSLFAFALGMEERGVWWGLVVVNWSAAIITLWWALRQIARSESGATAVPADQSNSIITGSEGMSQTPAEISSEPIPSE
jgi:putative MATE family efflux protein